jgi:hypothetical protein
MKSRERSLRALVERWIGAVPARVAHFGRAPSNRQRYARVEVIGDGRALGIYFFRYPDGSWGVCPSSW